MARVSTYLNFRSNTEDAFLFYKSVFGGEFEGKGISRFGDIPPSDGIPPLSNEDKNIVMHVALQLLGSHCILGTDAPESMGFNRCLTAIHNYLYNGKNNYKRYHYGSVGVGMGKMDWSGTYSKLEFCKR